MKKFSKIFLISFVVVSIFLIFIFGNMNFFGEQGFHMDIDTLILILTLWSLPSALIFSGIVCIISKFVKIFNNLINR